LAGYPLTLARFWPPTAGEEKIDLAVLFTKRAAVPTPLAPHEHPNWSKANAMSGGVCWK
jgi:hypothetical protein